MAGIKEIAKITGLSVATVSRVFNKDSLVSAKTREKVLKVAKDLEYQPNSMAAALRSGKNKIIGVLVPEVNNPFFSAIINGIEKIVSDAGYHIIIAQSHESEEKERLALQSFLKLKVEGILISVTQKTVDATLLQKISSSSTPIVFFDRLPSLKSINSVVLNDYKGAVLATEHLIEQNCKNIVHISGDTKTSIFREREKGFLDTVEKYKNSLNTHHTLALTNTLKEDFSSLERLFHLHPNIDGFFCYGDEVGLHVLNMLKMLNKNIPQDVKVIGFGNADFGKLIQPQLSSIDQKCDQMGRLTAKWLLKKLQNQETAAITEVLTPELVFRESTR